MSISFHHVTFAYDGATSPLLEDVTVHLAEGWTGIAGSNGAGKTTFLRLAAGHLQAQQGTIKRFGHIIFCPQRTDDVPAQLPLLISTIEAKACVLRGKLQIGDDWVNRWSTLSHGERKRAQIAVALWQQPDVLLLDEPTNHLDLPAIECLENALRDCPCGLLLISHDLRFLSRVTSKRWHLQQHGTKIIISMEN